MRKADRLGLAADDALIHHMQRGVGAGPVDVASIEDVVARLKQAAIAAHRLDDACSVPSEDDGFGGGALLAHPERAVGRQASGLPPSLTQKLSDFSSLLTFAGTPACPQLQTKPRLERRKMHRRGHCPGTAAAAVAFANTSTTPQGQARWRVPRLLLVAGGLRAPAPGP